MTTKKFSDVKVGQTISFTENGVIEYAIVSEVNDNIFTAVAVRCWDNNGVKSFYDSYFRFYKTGTKVHYRYTYGNAIEITCHHF